MASGDGRFKKGNPGGPGRPKHSKHKLSESFVKALADDFEVHGVEVINTVRADKPNEYLKIIAQIVPKDFNVSHQIAHEDALDELDGTGTDDQEEVAG